MSIENPTLVHFRHFSSLLTNLPSTTVKSPLQISSFMQNKPNFQKSQMNVNLYNTTDYENKSNWTLGENKPNSNPNKPNSRKAKMKLNPYSTKDYENIANWALGQNKPNTNPNKPNFKRYLAKMGHHELKYIDSLGQLTLNLFIKVNTQASSAERT